MSLYFGICFKTIEVSGTLMRAKSKVRFANGLQTIFFSLRLINYPLENGEDEGLVQFAAHALIWQIKTLVTGNH